MVQINLLPDVKKEYLHSQQSKHAFLIGAVLASILSLAILGLLFVYVQVAQPQHLSNLQTDIDQNVTAMKEVPNSVEMVTVQGALEQLPGLQDQKNITSRLFTYINGVTPREVSFAEVKLDLTTSTLSLRGDTTDYEQANVLANNIKSAELTFSENDVKNTIKPFSQIVFTDLGRAEQSQTTRNVSFQVDMQVDLALFRETVSGVKLSVDADSKELLIPSAKPFGEGGE